MKTTEGYIAAFQDGTFLRNSTVQTHVGTRTEAHSVADIEDATVYRSPCFQHRGEAPSQPVTWLPVQVRREVSLEGFGVSK